MKKLIILALLAVIMAGCGKKQDPLRYKGCAIVYKYDFPNYLIVVKLTPSLRDSLQEDYHTFYTVKYEWDKYNVGDTIR